MNDRSRHGVLTVAATRVALALSMLAMLIVALPPQGVCLRVMLASCDCCSVSSAEPSNSGSGQSCCCCHDHGSAAGGDDCATDAHHASRPGAPAHSPSGAPPLPGSCPITLDAPYIATPSHHADGQRQAGATPHGWTPIFLAPPAALPYHAPASALALAGAMAPAPADWLSLRGSCVLRV